MVNFQRTLWLFQALALQCWIPIHSTTEKEKNIFYSLSPKTQHGLLTAWLFIYCWNIIVYFIIIMSVVFCYPENTIKCYLSKKVEKHCIAILTVTFFPFTFSASSFVFTSVATARTLYLETDHHHLHKMHHEYM